MSQEPIPVPGLAAEKSKGEVVNDSQIGSRTIPPGEVPQVVEHLFRHEASKMVATLTRIFGINNLTLAEDVVQEALSRALQTWPYYGVPKNPAAWIMQVSKNLALDVVRREKTFRDKQVEISSLLEPGRSEGEFFSEDEIRDDILRMMFVCCHPLIPQEAQVSLALKTLCGFGVAEIGRAFLSSEAAIAKRITRAKEKIRTAEIPFEIPIGEELAKRLDGVLQTLYLLFNEGYKTSSGAKLIREEFCRESIRLALLLVNHPSGNRPKSHALLALMLFNGSRLSTRVDSEGNILRLREQDRTGWDRAMIGRGMFHLTQSAAGYEISVYHLQAGIAACHCSATDYDSTDWQQILSLYDRLVEYDDSPVVALNRAVAVANLHGPKAGIEAIESIKNRSRLDSYHLLYAVLGEFEMQLNRPKAAAIHFRKSLQFVETKSERRFLTQRLKACEDQNKKE